MKKLIVYYSLEGNTKMIAESMAQEIGADLLELTPLQDVSKKGFSKYIWGGIRLFLKNCLSCILMILI